MALRRLAARSTAAMNRLSRPASMCQNRPVDRNDVIAKLREHAAELRAAGLLHVCVFGSTARGENSSQSDVDLLVDFDPTMRQTLVTVGSLQSRLTTFPGQSRSVLLRLDEGTDSRKSTP